MQLIVSVVVFLIIAVVVMILFCFITRYFNKKLQRALQDENEVYSMIDEIRGQDQQNEDGIEGKEYDEFMNRRQNSKDDNTKKDTKFEIEMSDMKDPLGKFADQLYGKSSLKKRLDGDVAPSGKQTGRSVASIKSFKPDRLNSNRDTNRSINQEQDQKPQKLEEEEDIAKSGEDSHRPLKTKKKRKNKEKKNDVTTHKYTSKIIGYSEEGISILDKKVISIIKRGNQIQQKKMIKKALIKPSQSSFDDTLDAYGLEKNTFSACKFITTLQIPHMKELEEYPLSSLKKVQSKEEIQFAEFFQIKQEFDLAS